MRKQLLTASVVMVGYPREGHGLRETTHVVDALERSIAWYKKYFR